VAHDVLTARADAIAQVLQAAPRLAPQLAAHPGIAAFLEADVKAAIGYLPDGPFTVRCPPSLADAAQHAVAAAGEARGLVRADPEAPFGLILSSEDGSVAVDATIARRIERAAPRLAIAVAQWLLEPAT
jgi:vacuolar-type H+-ATPase subunit E/Vma4